MPAQTPAPSQQRPALHVELFCGRCSHTLSKLLRDPTARALAIDIEPLCPVATFEQNATNLLEALRASRKSPLADGRIYTAGELENDQRKARTAQGGLSVPGPLQKNMTDLRDKIPALKAKYPKLPFE